jgi:hypothetical protein
MRPLTFQIRPAAFHAGGATAPRLDGKPLPLVEFVGTPSFMASHAALPDPPNLLRVTIASTARPSNSTGAPFPERLKRVRPRLRTRLNTEKVPHILCVARTRTAARDTIEAIADTDRTLDRFTPAAAMVMGSKESAASSHAATSPLRVAPARKDAASEVLPVLGRPMISLIRPRTIPPPRMVSIEEMPELSRWFLRVSSRPRKTPANSRASTPWPCRHRTDQWLESILPRQRCTQLP